MDWASILKNLLEVSPFVGLLGGLYWQERKNRIAIYERLFNTLQAQVEQGDALRRALLQSKKEKADDDE